MATHLFGTDGIRGVPGEYPLDDVTLHALGRALGEHVGLVSSRAKVILGMDTRESGSHIAGRLLSGLSMAGVECAFAGVLTTPGVACLVRQHGFAAGVVISASHNPYTDNGVKLFSRSGMKFPDVAEAGIEKRLLELRDNEATHRRFKLTPDPSLHAEYVAFLQGAALPGAKLAGMKIVLDGANGAASELAPEVFRALGADVTAIHCAPDGRNINVQCGSLHPESLQAKVQETGAALGVAFDGDADRAIFVSARGRLVNGDGVLLAAARYMKGGGTLKAGRVVGTTMANLGLEKALAADGIALTREAVGDRYVLEGMQRDGANLGGEQSGHIIFLDDAPTGDGILTAIKVASLVALRGPLDDLIAGLKVYPQVIINVRVREKKPLEAIPPVAAALAEAQRALDGNGRVVLRYSGTEPLARVMVEAESQGEVDRWSQAIATAIRNAIGTTS
jgi:phosphoglucosamine mutase